MLKQSPSRNQRSKGFKVKHAIQICLLLAICIWLLYQVKHSHDKKKAYEESSAKISEKVQTGDEIIKLGRKDLHPRVQEITLETERRGGKEEEEVEESKPEESEDDGRGGGDDEIDGHDQERAEEEESEEVEDLIDVEDKEREEEIEEHESEEKGDQTENGSSLEDQAQTEGERISQEAREEHYKRDDASRAVLQDTQMIRTEFEFGGLRKVKEEVGPKAERIELDHENDINGTKMVVDIKDSGLEAGNSETAENGAFGNAMHGEGKGNDFNSANSNVGLNSTSSIKAEANEQWEMNKNSTLMLVETLSYLNGTDILLESIHHQNLTSNVKHSHLQAALVERNESSNSTTGYDQSNFNLTLSTNGNLYAAERELAISSGSRPVVLDRNVKYDAAAITGERSTSSATNGIDGADDREDSNANDGAEKREATSSSLRTDENVDAVQNESFDSFDSSFYQEDKDDSFDSSFYQEDKEDPNVLETLPEIKFGANNSEDAAK